MIQNLLQIAETLWTAYSTMLKANPVVGGMMTLYVTGILTYVFKSIPQRIFNYIKSQFIVSVAIHNEDPLFRNATKWLEKEGRVFRCKSFTATLIHGTDKTYVSISVGNGNHMFFHNGRIFWLSRVEKEANNTTERKESLFVSTIGWYPDSIRRFLQDVVPQPKTNQETHIHNFADSYWYSQQSKECRKLDSVILTEANEKALRDYITQYLNEKEWYKANKIPWRAGIVLSGPPGTGKSTLSLALCGEFNCNLFIANLSLLSDEKILAMFKTLPPRSIILVEDIDSYNVTRNRQKNKKDKGQDAAAPGNPKGITRAFRKTATGGIAMVQPDDPDKEELSLFNSLSGLLNAIDGICSTEDRILIATTNHIERLDPALIRPGRFELILKIDNLDDETVRKMFKKFYPSFALPENFKVKPGISPVQFQTLVIGNKKNPQALVDFCSDGETNGNS